MITLPQQPAIYREWLAESRRGENRATALLLAGSLAAEPDVFATVDAVLAELHLAFHMPTEVAEAYEAWRTEYNAKVVILNRERQARINAREIAKIRAAACPRCFATHAGEC